jgi:hypothetical protein
MKYNRFLPLVMPLLSWILLELYYYKAQLVYVSLVLFILIAFFACRQFAISYEQKEKWWDLMILPFVFYVGIIGISLLIPSAWFVQFLFFVNVVFQYFYFRTVYSYMFKPKKYRFGTLENLSSYGNFLAFYFITSTIFGLQVFVNFDVWILIIILVFFTALIVYQVLWANKIDKKRSAQYILIASLILAEITWAASFLTLSFYILGLLVAICYYILIGLTRFYLLNKLNFKVIRYYIIFGFGSIIIVLLTAKWIS